MAGAQHPAGSIPVGTWSLAGPHGIQGLASGGGPGGHSAQAYSTTTPLTGHPGWTVSLLSSVSLPCFFSGSGRRRQGLPVTLPSGTEPGATVELYPPPPLLPATPPPTVSPLDSKSPCASGEGSPFLSFLLGLICSRTDSGQTTRAKFCRPERCQVSLGAQTDAQKALPPRAKRQACQSREKPALRCAL